jgi:hypothetical protein
VAFRDWSEGDYEDFSNAAYENIYANIDGVQGLNDEGQERAEELFEQGWLTFGEYSPEELQSIRDDFYDLVGLTEDMFDWIEYRDLYAEAGG